MLIATVEVPSSRYHFLVAVTPTLRHMLPDVRGGHH